MKRGESGLSLLVAVDKPSGMSSHDVVNRVRRIFGERRVGHTGTLDPLATGVLPICIGPAARLDRFMTGHDKRYRVRIAFGCETTTDDVLGEPTVAGGVPGRILDEGFAAAYVAGLAGEHDQVPPAYSAIKVDGKRSYAAARAGDAVELEPRRIEVYEAALVRCDGGGGVNAPCWTVDLAVSKGTYVRALARDIGRDIGCPAHVAALQRLSAGSISLADCHSLESLEALGADAALDPVRVLGFRFFYADGFARLVESGAKLPGNLAVLHEFAEEGSPQSVCACTSDVARSAEPPRDGELASAVSANRLKAVYAYDARAGAWKAQCVFSEGVARG